jgi:hypothetical protein
VLVTGVVMPVVAMIVMIVFVVVRGVLVLEGHAAPVWGLIVRPPGRSGVRDGRRRGEHRFARPALARSAERCLAEPGADSIAAGAQDVLIASSPSFAGVATSQLSSPVRVDSVDFGARIRAIPVTEPA